MSDFLSLGNNYSRDFFTDVSLGRIPGHRRDSFFGSNEDIDLGPNATLWPFSGNKWVRPIVASEFYISSTSASDTANTFFCTMLDANFDRSLQAVTPNGQTPVIIPGGPFLRINGAVNISGSVSTATPSVGDIYINAEDNHTAGVPDDATKVQGLIQMRNGLSSDFAQFGHFTIPAGHTGILYDVFTWVGKGKEASINFMVAPNPPGGQSVELELVNFKQFENVTTANILAVPLTERTDIHFTVTAENNNSAASMNAQLVVIDNNFIQS